MLIDLPCHARDAMRAPLLPPMMLMPPFALISLFA